MRFGVVMYGGVSLAIYINGVANELYEMACSTPRDGIAAGADHPASDDDCNTRCVYRWVSALLAEPGLLDKCRRHVVDHPEGELRHFFARDDVAADLETASRTRFVVDVVSGTSAGGINGLFLAKALANGEPFELLRDLWIEEGDIGKLLNDDGSRADDKSLPPLDGLPRSLLNSDRMYQRLLKALRQMSARREQGGRGPPVVDELDLFVTTTDIRGSTLQLRLFDKLVPETRHRQVFRLRSRGGASSDFDDANLPFLAYVARCTSSFPFAFEPMTLDAITRGGGGEVGAADRERWQALVAGSGGGEDRAATLDRAYGDGGYLDNKPFSHAIEALSQREAEVPVERKLVFVEPSPQHPEDRDAALGGRRPEPPDAVQNAMAALLTIPRHETIREDLEAVLQRNRLIERVDRIVRLGERDLEVGHADDPYLRALAERPRSAADWDSMTLAELRRYYGDAFLPYRRLRVYMTTDKLAERLAQLWGVDAGSDRLYALRVLVRVWRDDRYPDDIVGESVPGRRQDAGTLNAFLNRFDLRFRTRRLRFLLRRVDALYRLLLKHDGQRLTQPVGQMSELHQMLVARLRRHSLDLERPLVGFDVDTARRVLLGLRGAFLRARQQTRDAERELPGLGGKAAVEPRERLRDLMGGLLDLLLATGDGKADAARSPDAATLLALMPDDVLKKLGDADRQPFSTRSLQERVLARARIVFEGMAGHEATALQSALEADVERIGDLIQQLVRGTPGRAALSAVGRLLGVPDWDFVDTGIDTGIDTGTGERLAVVKVGDVEEGVVEGDEGRALRDLLNTAEGRLLRRLLGGYYLRYDSFDQMSLPLYYGTDTGEPAPVEVVRISPEDATSLVDERRSGRSKLAGTALGNFGGFLDEQWRRNDILWGRLDGAERLIHALLPAEADRGVRAALTAAAHRAIARDILAPAERAQLGALLLKALDKLERDGARAPVDDRSQARMLAMLQALNLTDPGRRRQVERAVGSLFDDRGLLEYLRSAHEVDRRLEPKRAMGYAARALTVAGRVLEGVAEGREVQPLVRWTARIGIAAQGVLAAAVPGSLWALVSRHWLTVLYLFELAMVLVGTLMASEDMRSAGLTALALTAIVHAAILLVRDLMRERPPWRSTAVRGALAFFLALAAVGAWSLHKLPWDCLRPAAHCAPSAPQR
jgi:patatin-related protein